MMSNNVKWVSLIQAIKVFGQMAFLFIVAAYLTPSQYALVAILSTVSAFSLLIRDLGTSSSLIQRASLSDSIIDTVFTLNVICGIIVFLFLIFLSPYLSLYFKSDELKYLIYIMSFSFPIASSTSIHVALMERASKFYQVAQIEIFSFLISMSLSLAILIFYKTIYAVPIQLLLYAIISSLLLFLKSRRKVKFELSAFHEIFSYSSHVTGFGVINFFSRNIDVIVIARVLGGDFLGPYSLAYRIVLFPVQNITTIVNRSFLPIMSRNVSNGVPNDLLYISSLKNIMYIVVPMMLGLILVREEIVQLFFGDDWHLVSDIIVYLAFVGLIQSLVSTTGTIFMAYGQTKLLLILGVLGTILHSFAFIVGANVDIFTLCKLYIVISIINAFICLERALRSTGASLYMLLNNIYKPILSGVFMYLIVTLLSSTFENVISNDGHILLFGFKVFIGVVSYVGAVFSLDKKTCLTYIERFYAK